MIAKAVIPAAGLGTRFLPATKAQPKEMLPIVDTPTIQYVVEEAADSGIRDVLIITGRGKRAIEDHFDRAIELEAHLQEKGNEEQLRELRRLASLARIHFIRQESPRGLGDAISCARCHVGDEPFVVLLGDSIVDSRIPCARQLIDVFNRHQTPVIGVEEVAPENVGRYGIVGGEAIAPDTWRVASLVEKPRPAEAPSRLAVAGRYVLTPEIFDYLDKTPRGVGDEIQLTDALRLMLRDRPITAYRYEGKRHDTGNRLEYLKTVVEYAAKREDVGPEFRQFLRTFVRDLGS